MGSGNSTLFPCFKRNKPAPDDETTGHSFCYFQSSSNYHESTQSSYRTPSVSAASETGFKAISCASVIANTSTPTTTVSLIDITDDDAIAASNFVNLSGFQSNSSFTSLPLQLSSLALRRGGYGEVLMEPLDSHNGGQVHFSAPLGSMYVKRKRRRGVASIRKALHKNFLVKKRPWLAPMLNSMTSLREKTLETAGNGPEIAKDGESNVHWALGKAGEDRAHIVISEEHGWLFVGIYDGFNGPDAPEFLMCNLYPAVFWELRGLFWEPRERKVKNEWDLISQDRTRRVTEVRGQRRHLWEFFAEEDTEDISGSSRFAFRLVKDAGSALRRRWQLLSKLKHGLLRRRERNSFGLEDKAGESDSKDNYKVLNGCGPQRKRKEGHIDHEMVLRAMSRALQITEDAFLDLTNKVLDSSPEFSLMGSCLLVVLMRDEDVYVMNVGDSRAIVAQYEPQELEPSAGETVLTPLQLSTDHSTSIEEEVTRIQKEHPDDSCCIVDDRVKGRLKVTRAFGAGFLKQPKLNNSLLEMFRYEYVGTAPYISCVPSLCHHRLCPKDQFLILSSDGLYEYMSKHEVVSQVESFMENFPDGDPAQHLIEELLCRAAKKAGMEFHELLDIPQGDRRKYHDDVTVMVISLEGRIWKSSGNDI